MKQQSLASQSVFEKYGRKSRRELFLEEMEKLVPYDICVGAWLMVGRAPLNRYGGE